MILLPAPAALTKAATAVAVFTCPVCKQLPKSVCRTTAGATTTPHQRRLDMAAGYMFGR